MAKYFINPFFLQSCGCLSKNLDMPILISQGYIFWNLMFATPTMSTSRKRSSKHTVCAMLHCSHIDIFTSEACTRDRYLGRLHYQESVPVHLKGNRDTGTCSYPLQVFLLSLIFAVYALLIFSMRMPKANDLLFNIVLQKYTWKQDPGHPRGSNTDNHQMHRGTP